MSCAVVVSPSHALTRGTRGLRSKCRSIRPIRTMLRDWRRSCARDLQRPRFEPDVAADLSDRGENRDPGAATEAITQLTTEVRLENAPFQARSAGRGADPG